MNDTGISLTTVRSLLIELLEEDKIIRLGLDQSTGGRRAQRYALNINKKYVLSIYLEERHLVYGVVNILGNTIDTNSLRIENYLDQTIIDQLLDQVITQYKNIVIIGISVPGIVQMDGYLSGKTTEQLKLIDINRYIEEKYNIPVILENDLNAIALGYCHSYKKNKNFHPINMVYIHFSTLGAGAGIIINGEIIRGKDKFSGEIGFLPIGDSILNEVLFQDIKDEEYCSMVINILAIIDCMINPELVVIGGNHFNYSLFQQIKSTYYQDNKTTCELIAIQDSSEFSLNGISELALDYIREELKLIGKNKVK